MLLLKAHLLELEDQALEKTDFLADCFLGKRLCVERLHALLQLQVLDFLELRLLLQLVQLLVVLLEQIEQLLVVVLSQLDILVSIGQGVFQLKQANDTHSVNA